MFGVWKVTDRSAQSPSTARWRRRAGFKRMDRSPTPRCGERLSETSQGIPERNSTGQPRLAASSEARNVRLMYRSADSARVAPGGRTRKRDETIPAGTCCESPVDPRDVIFCPHTSVPPTRRGQPPLQTPHVDSPRGAMSRPQLTHVQPVRKGMAR
jgi:hypothetical protein